MKSGWHISTLGDVLAVLRNGVNCKQDKSGKGDKISRIESISDASFDLGRVGYAELSDRDKERYRLQVGDILFSHINSPVHVGKTAVFNSSEPVYHGVNLLLMRPKAVVTSAYLDHALKYHFQSGYWRSVCKQSVNQASVNQQDISRVQISYPKSIREQQRIVGILDEAFDGIATAKANAEKNLHNARALFEIHLHSVFIQRGEGWVDRTLDQVCVVERGSSPRPIKEYFTTDPDGVNWIKIGDTEEGGKYVYSTAQKITPKGAKQSRFVKEGDFILTNSMSFGRPYIMKTSGYIHDGWFVLRLNISIDTDYFYYLLSSRFVQSQFAQLASGSVVKNISGDLVKKAILPIPPLAQQHVIVKKLLEISAETQRLESLYQQKLAALDELKKSLLHQAFSGEL